MIDYFMIDNEFNLIEDGLAKQRDNLDAWTRENEEAVTCEFFFCDKRVHANSMCYEHWSEHYK